MIVTLAGPGAGKTTDLIQQIVKVIPNVSVNREIAVITYTNASANDLREKLMEKMSIPKNLFVGTIHSFLFKYYIQPFAQEIGFETSNTIIIDKFNDVGVDWVEGWAKRKIDPAQRNQRIKAIKLGKRNRQLEAAAKKGIYTFDGIIKISKTLSEDKNISRAISNRLQYLFVDEYQDIDKYGHNIIMQLYKQKKTIISIVGDPDQSIYRFRYENSQIGEQAPKKGKQPLNELMDLSENSSDVELRELTINHRSSKEIVEFNNRYGTLSNQEAENASVCPVQFLDSVDIEIMKKRLFEEGEKYGCESYLILAKENSTLHDFEDVLEETSDIKIGIYDINHIIDIFIADTGLSKKRFQEKYNLSKFQIRRIAIATRTALINKQISPDNISNYFKGKIQELFSIDVNLGNDQTTDNDGKKLSYGYKSDIEQAEKVYVKNVKCMTIHKSKGLEADVVLVLANTESELLKWLNMTKTNMKSDADETYRLGYVAFTRPRKVLILACIEKVDISKIKSNVKICVIT